MSQAGLTKADKAAFLEAHGWTKLPRKPGAALRWRDPVEGFSWITDKAYEVAKEREVES